MSLPIAQYKTFKVVSTALAALLVTAAASKAQQSCSVDSATGSVALQMDTESAQVAGVEQQILIEMDKIQDTIPARDRNSTKPLGQLLSPMNAGRYGELSEKLKVMRVGQLFGSYLSRDALFVDDMWKAAKASYVDSSKAPKDNDVPGTTLFIMRALFPNPQPTNAQAPSTCSIDTALVIEENQALQRWSSASKQQDAATATVNAMRSKYGQPTGALDPNKMNISDLDTLQKLRANVFEPLIRETLYISDLENIRAWYAAAQVVYAAHRDALATYGADADRINKAFATKISLLPDKSKKLEALWERIDGLVPSDAAKGNQILQDTITRCGAACTSPPP